MSPSATRCFDAIGNPAIISVLHLPDPFATSATSPAQLEDYVLANAQVFAQAGIPAMMLQDQTRETGDARPATVAVMSALGRLVRREFPAMKLGIIVQAHDAVAPLAIAHAADACFVRLKIFVAAAMTMEGPRIGLGVPARSYRHALGRDDIAILADVFDRTSLPMVDVSSERASRWAESLGADGIVLTGESFEDSLARIGKARSAGLAVPLIIGGGVTTANVAQALRVADGVIVSTSLMRTRHAPDEILRWDRDETHRFMDVVRSLSNRT